MTSRTLFHIVLKILGVYFIKELFLLVPELLSAIIYFRSETLSSLWTVFLIILIAAIYALAINYLLFKTDWVIETLKLDQGIEETIAINLHRSTVLFSVLCIAGIIVTIRALPFLCRAAYNYYRESQAVYLPSQADKSGVILYGAQFALGLILILFARTLTNFIELKRRNTQNAAT